MQKRIIFDIVVLALVFSAPWWVIAMLAFIGAFIWTEYYEILLFGLLLDILYGASTLHFGGAIGVTFSALLYFLAQYIRSAIR